MNVKFFGGIALALIAVGGILVFFNNPKQPAPSSATTTAQTPTTTTPVDATTTTATQTYTLADVAMHNSANSCWTAINGKVYDVTKWINQHPGGSQAILSLCGTDGSAAFNGQHGGQGRPASELATFYLADLAQ